MAHCITSMWDPLALEPSVDVFVASYSPAGTLLWLQQGAAPFTDRAIDIVADAASDLYVCGQFSDTITFDQTHNNVMSNATFLLKLDASGDEQWFRRCGGATFDHVRDMQLSSNGDLLLCGDLQGAMVFFDAIPDPIAGPDPYSTYVLRVGVDGELMDHVITGSSSPVSALALDQRADSVSVFGEFQCQFTGLSDFYGASGLFMATGPQDLFITRYGSADLDLGSAQQFGGQNDKNAGGIASLLSGALIFSGAYERLLVFPSDGGIWGDTQSGIYECVGGLLSADDPIPSYCGDPYYGKYAANVSAGSDDGFLARAYVIGRSPYDPWNRIDSLSCDRSMFEPCIGYQSCVDTLFHCGSFVISPVGWLTEGSISWVDDMFCDSALYTGFDLSFLWSTGDTTSWLGVVSPGWYWCTVSTTNGCWSWTDSVYVQIDVPVTPLISDGLGVNVAAVFAEPLICVGPTWVWSPDIPPGYTAAWSEVGGELVAGDSVLADSSTYYVISITSPLGCAWSNTIMVVIGDSIGLPNITGMEIDLDVPGDTIVQCPFGLVSGYADITWYFDGVPGPPDPDLLMHVYSSIGTGYYAWMDDILTWFTLVDSSGWLQVEMTVEIMDSPCGDDTLTFTVTDSLYAQLVPWAEATIIAPPMLCPGDTVPLVIQCTGCDTVVWSGPGITSVSATGDTAWVNNDGFYQATVSGTFGLLTCPWTTAVYLDMPVAPALYSAPDPGIICVGDSALIWTTAAALDYAWTGPGDLITGSNDTIIATDFGEYFLSITDMNGCVLSNGPITIEQFATPYITAFPDAVICMGETVTIQVITSDSAAITWNAPLSGNGTTQVITTPGVYSAWVAACGGNFLASITITPGTADASLLDSGPFTFCAGDSVLLQAQQDMAYYQWFPGGANDDSLWVFTSGTYQLTVTDPFGCTASSELVIVTEQEFTVPLLIEDVEACVGGSATFTAIGSGTITWYADPNGAVPLGSGPAFIIDPVTGPQTIYAAQEESGCTSAVQSVELIVVPGPPAPVIVGDLLLCEGEFLQLTATSAPGTTITWVTPSGPVTGSTVSLGPVGVGAKWDLSSHRLGCERVLQHTQHGVRDDRTMRDHRSEHPYAERRRRERRAHRGWIRAHAQPEDLQSLGPAGGRGSRRHRRMGWPDIRLRACAGRRLLLRGENGRRERNADRAGRGYVQLMR